MLLSALKRLFQFRELLWVWTLRDIKIRYKQSFLGSAWAILQPLSLMILLSTIFTLFYKIPTDGVPYPIFSYAALLPWTFLATSVSFGSTSLVGNFNLITKIAFPREIIPIGVVLASLVDLLVASLVFVGLILFYRVPFRETYVFTPLLLIIQVFLVMGIVLFTSAMNVFFRDIRYLVPLVLQLWMYATPIIYPLSAVPEQFQPIYLLNPMAGLIDSYRRTLLYHQAPQWDVLAVSSVFSIVIFLGGYLYFKRVEPRFADII